MCVFSPLQELSVLSGPLLRLAEVGQLRRRHAGLQVSQQAHANPTLSDKDTLNTKLVRGKKYMFLQTFTFRQRKETFLNSLP